MYNPTNPSYQWANPSYQWANPSYQWANPSYQWASPRICIYFSKISTGSLLGPRALWQHTIRGFASSHTVQFAALFLNQATPFLLVAYLFTAHHIFFHMIGLGGHNFFLCFLDLRKLDARKKRQQNTLPSGDGKVVIYHCSTISVKKIQPKEKIPGTQNDDPGCVLRWMEIFGVFFLWRVHKFTPKNRGSHSQAPTVTNPRF